MSKPLPWSLVADSKPVKIELRPLPKCTLTSAVLCIIEIGLNMMAIGCQLVDVPPAVSQSIFFITGTFTGVPGFLTFRLISNWS